MSETKIDQPANTHVTDIGGLVVQLKDGSYAIVLFLIIIFILSRKAFTEFLKEHIEIMRSLKDSNKENSETLNKTTKAVERISRNNTILTTLLAKHFNLDLSGKDDEDMLD